MKNGEENNLISPCKNLSKQKRDSYSPPSHPYRRRFTRLSSRAGGKEPWEQQGGGPGSFSLWLGDGEGWAAWGTTGSSERWAPGLGASHTGHRGGQAHRVQSSQSLRWENHVGEAGRCDGKEPGTSSPRGAFLKTFPIYYTCPVVVTALST